MSIGIRRPWEAVKMGLDPVTEIHTSPKPKRFKDER